MQFSSAISTDTDLEAACRSAVRRARHELGDAEVTLCAVFASATFRQLDSLPAVIADEVDASCTIGCCGGGVVGGGREV